MSIFDGPDSFTWGDVVDRVDGLKRKQVSQPLGPTEAEELHLLIEFARDVIGSSDHFPYQDDKFVRFSDSYVVGGSDYVLVQNLVD